MSLPPGDAGLKVTLISLHGLIRGERSELGRDADTGGQIKYVLELARELAIRPEIDHVELLTRQVIDPKVDDDYAQIEERLSEKAKIVRIPFGPKRYLRKEALWPYLEMFVDQTLSHFRRAGLPDVIHGHYADAGMAGAQLARLLHIPFVFTGHSLGRVKRQRLSLGKTSPETLEKKYRFTQRIEAEEVALETASLVVTSTTQEVSDQYEIYDHYVPERMEVIPPGVDLDHFAPPAEGWTPSPYEAELRRFLREPERPLIMAMARPDERKNLEKLVEVYGRSEKLRDAANLLLIMGTRDELADLPGGQRTVLENVLRLIDKHDLYGQVAYPKRHAPDDVPELYRLVAARRGVFINAALTEPFGLTLLEAGATGAPIVATNDGGPRDIIANCENGLLVDPLEDEQIEHALLRVLTNADEWDRWSANGVTKTREHYSWSKHVDRYLRDVGEILGRAAEPALVTRPKAKRLPEFDRLIITDLDNTLTGDDVTLAEFKTLLAENDHVGFGIATGRRLDSAMRLIEDLDLPRPDLIDSDAGTQIHYGASLTPDRSWRKQIAFSWRPDELRAVMADLPGIGPQGPEHDSEFKVSYEIDPTKAPSLSAIKKRIRAAGLRAKAVLSLGAFLDLVPVRGGSDMTLRHVLWKWGFPPEHVLVAGDSGNDAGMLLGRTLGVVVANYGPEMRRLRNRPRIYFSDREHAGGILDGIAYYDFLGNITIPNDHVES